MSADPDIPEETPAEWFEVLAETSRSLAGVLLDNADILQLVADNRDHHHEEARAQAARDRRLAAALRDAAEAFANHRMPSDETWEILREG